MRILLGAIVLAAALVVTGHQSAGALAGLPEDGPPALYKAEPALPAPAGWPATESFPRTSGTGRLADGGLFWTDFIYDDHGAVGAVPGGNLAEAGVPSFGQYRYPPGPSKGNGADIFRAAVVSRPDATYWRVDWNTLVDPSVPIAEWAMSTGGAAGDAWPAAAGVHSPGIDRALIVSSRGASLQEVVGGRRIATLPVTVDRAARSFVVRIPRALLNPTGTWRVRLAAGLANPAGTAFASVPGALPGEPAVYNVTFRTPQQESPTNNFWNDDTQALALATGDVTPFAVDVRWSDLAARRETPEPAPTGWSVRWYVSSVEPGAGRVTDVSEEANGLAAYLGRVQPYSVYVPKSRPSPAPLTFMLHSLTQNHNQYAATTPRFVQAACEARHSICVSTLGRGPSGNYMGTAELDFWEVWHAAAATYALSPDRTVLSGYSMGGIGSNDLAMAHPDLFARSVTLAGAVGAVPAEVNLRWVPTYLAGGLADELVPVTDEYAEAHALDGFGYQYRWLLYPAEDHVAFELQDGFSDAAAYMGAATRVTHPGRVTFRWRPGDSDPTLGVGTTGAYWLRHLVARDHASDAVADASDGTTPDRAIVASRTTAVIAPGDPTPAVASELHWQRGPSPSPTNVVVVHLTNVASLTLLVSPTATLDVTSDGPVTISVGSRLIRMPAGRHRG